MFALFAAMVTRRISFGETTRTSLRSHDTYDGNDDWGKFLFEDIDGGGDVREIGRGVLDRSGHLSYLPGNEWILNDTYPKGSARMQTPHLLYVSSGRRIDLGDFHLPPIYKVNGESTRIPGYRPTANSFALTPRRRVREDNCILIDISGVLGVALLALCLWLLGPSELRAAESDIKSAAKQVTQIIAHRGASAERPECTLAAIRRAIDVGATAVEVDVRTSKDGELFILHDATLDRTTTGTGPANALTLAQLQQLDAGSWFDPKYRGQRIPSLIQAAEACRGRIDLLLDLKEQGDDYDPQVVGVIRNHGDPAKTIVGVRSVAQAKRFRTLLPQARQLALIPSVDSIEEFAKAGVDTIRLWPRWLEDGDEPVKRVRAAGKRLHLNGTMGEFDETLELLAFQPDSLSSDHPAQLKRTLERIAARRFARQTTGGFDRTGRRHATEHRRIARRRSHVSESRLSDARVAGRTCRAATLLVRRRRRRQGAAAISPGRRGLRRL